MKRDPAEAAENRLAEGIEQTRAEMTTTFDQLDDRVREIVKEGIGDAKVMLSEQIHVAKAAVHDEIGEAKIAISQQLGEARTAVDEQIRHAKDALVETLTHTKQAVKTDIEGAINRTKQSVRAATLGRAEDIATQAGDLMNTAKDTLIDTVKQNPIPAALAGIGIAWLLMNRSSSARRRAGARDDIRVSPETGGMSPMNEARAAGGRVVHQASDLFHRVEGGLESAGQTVADSAQNARQAVAGAVHQGMDAATDMAHQTSDTARRWAHGAAEATGHVVHGAMDATIGLSHQAQDMAGNAVDAARDGALRVERGLESTFQSRPLLLGAAVFAAGAAIAYALPGTSKENELMGGTRDRMLRGATDVAREAAHSLQHLTGEAGTMAEKAISAR